MRQYFIDRIKFIIKLVLTEMDQYLQYKSFLNQYKPKALISLALNMDKLQIIPVKLVNPARL